MGVTWTKLARPAVTGDYGLGVDEIANPTSIIAFRSAGPQTNLDEVARRPYCQGEEAVSWLIDSVRFPTGIARGLETQLAMKVHAASLRV